MLSSGRAMLRTAAAGQYDTPIVISKAGTITDMGRTQISWDAPATVTTVQGTLQPAGTKALERAGLLGQEGIHQVYMEPTAVTPSSNRLTIDGRTFEVLSCEAWPSHTAALLREVAS